MKIGDIIHGFKLLSITPVEEKQMESYLFVHEQSGAQLIWLSCDDTNKGFSIAFKTIPQDHTGVFHIIEHSVLCGSKKYPVKEPFVDLLKGSMQTFLNAITFGDKTMYPVASTNDKDFLNLMDVYLDAVFNPRFYENESIFLQEGWHFEPEKDGTPAHFSGVVYNEMKGSFSSPDTQFFDGFDAALLPDTCYALCSGGNPRNIPELSYEQFLATHKKFYHPENSYICLYGNVKIEEVLQFINESYLSHYQKQGIHFDFVDQKPLGFREVHKEYEVQPGSDLSKKAIFGYGILLPEKRNKKLVFALDILLNTLTRTQDSQLSKAIMDAHIGESFSAWINDDTNQQYLTFRLKNTDAEQKDTFLKLLKDTLEDIAIHGIDHKELEATFNSMEFSILENDKGYCPGVDYAITVMNTWLYGDNPNDTLFDKALLDELRPQIEKGYFESLIQEYILNNNHSVLFVLTPSVELQKQNELANTEQVQKYIAGLSKEQLQAWDEKLLVLNAFQTKVDTPEEKATIPHIELSDIDPLYKTAHPVVLKQDDVDLHYYDYSKNGISYFRSYQDITKLSYEEMPYASILSRLIFNIRTQNYTMSEYTSAVESNFGTLTLSLLNLTDYGTENTRFSAILNASFLDRNYIKAKELIEEGLFRPVFEQNELRIALGFEKARLESDLTRNGTAYARIKANQYLSAEGYAQEQIRGYTYVKFIQHLVEHFDELYEDLLSHFERILNAIREGSFIRALVSCDKTLQEMNQNPIHLGTPFEGPICYLPEVEHRITRTARKDSSQVCYSAMTAKYVDESITYTGALNVVSQILSLDYLWNRVRVIGGAYGTSCDINGNGHVELTSYRDPNLEKTYETFENAVSYLENFDCSDDELVKYIIGTMSSYDQPLQPRNFAFRATSRIIIHYTEEQAQENRTSLLHCKIEDIHRFANILKKALTHASICTFGSAKKIEESQGLFDEVLS